eukprot:m.264775 g.264775  ORF g.264775 m.264775 type:complete len:680 (+) comp15622_c0_seq2:63-2102(+)
MAKGDVRSQFECFLVELDAKLQEPKNSVELQRAFPQILKKLFVQHNGRVLLLQEAFPVASFLPGNPFFQLVLRFSEHYPGKLDSVPMVQFLSAIGQALAVRSWGFDTMPQGCVTLTSNVLDYLFPVLCDAQGTYMRLMGVNPLQTKRATRQQVATLKAELEGNVLLAPANWLSIVGSRWLQILSDTTQPLTLPKVDVLALLSQRICKSLCSHYEALKLTELANDMELLERTAALEQVYQQTCDLVPQFMMYHIKGSDFDATTRTHFGNLLKKFMRPWDKHIGFTNKWQWFVESNAHLYQEVTVAYFQRCTETISFNPAAWQRRQKDSALGLLCELLDIVEIAQRANTAAQIQIQSYHTELLPFTTRLFKEAAVVKGPTGLLSFFSGMMATPDRNEHAFNAYKQYLRSTLLKKYIKVVQLGDETVQKFTQQFQTTTQPEAQPETPTAISELREPAPLRTYESELVYRLLDQLSISIYRRNFEVSWLRDNCTVDEAAAEIAQRSKGQENFLVVDLAAQGELVKRSPWRLQTRYVLVVRKSFFTDEVVQLPVQHKQAWTFPHQLTIDGTTRFPNIFQLVQYYHKAQLPVPLDMGVSFLASTSQMATTEANRDGREDGNEPYFLTSVGGMTPPPLMNFRSLADNRVLAWLALIIVACLMFGFVIGALVFLAVLFVILMAGSGM